MGSKFRSTSPTNPRIDVKLGAGQIGNEMVDRGFDGARGVEGLGFVGLKLFDVVHGKYRKIKSYCSTWNMLCIR
jgi:hypothetical protein